MRAANRKTGGGAVNRAVAREMASLMPASWNQIADWLRRLDAFRQAA